MIVVVDDSVSEWLNQQACPASGQLFGVGILDCLCDRPGGDIPPRAAVTVPGGAW